MCSATSSPTRPPTSLRNWEQIKKDEKGATSIVEGITAGLPSLLYTNKLFRKAASLGLDPGSLDEALDRIDIAVARLRTDSALEIDANLEADLAQVLAAAVVIARAGNIDAESALRGWAARYRRRFEAMERLATEREPRPRRASTKPASPPSGSKPRARLELRRRGSM